MHGEEDARHNLHDQYQQRQATHVVPEVEVLGRVILGQMGVPEIRDRQALVHPVQETRGLTANTTRCFTH